MKFRKSTRYALYAATELARIPGGSVTAAEVADRYGVPVSMMAKVFQALVRGGISVGMRGLHGGYRLARPASEITMLNIISLFEAHPFANGRPEEAEAGAECTGARRLRRVFDEVDEIVRCTYASISLETVLGEEPVNPGPRSGD